MDESDLDFAIDEINREQDRWNYMEAELNAAEKRIVELEAALKQQTAYCKKCCRDNEYSPRLVATEKKMAELEEALQSLVNCLPQSELEIMRGSIGNTNTAVIYYWIDKAKNALNK